MSYTHAEMAAQAEEIVAAAAEQGIAARVVGGAGIWASLSPGLRAGYETVRAVPHDVDVLVPKGRGPQIAAVMESLGYGGDERFNQLRGDRRQCWGREGEGRLLEVDLFIGQPPLCHPIEFQHRLDLPGPALPATDLLLQKLQVVEINQKDLIDAAFLLLDNPTPRDADGGDALELDWVLSLVSRDWGFHHTATTNLGHAAEASDGFMDGDAAGLVRDRAALILEAIEAEPKSLKWKARAKVGTRVQWYEEVEEIVRQ